MIPLDFTPGRFPPRYEMHQWVYVSKFVPPADAEKAIKDIVEVGRVRNSELQVTGALFFTGIHFAQVLEGPPKSVLALRSSIMADARHADVITMLAGKIQQRRFEGWSLAYSGPSLVLSRAIHRCVRERGPTKHKSAEFLVDLMVEIAGRPNAERSKPTLAQDTN